MNRVVSFAALLLLTAAGPSASDRTPEGYAVRLRVVPAPGGGIQRLALPGAAVAALRNRDGSDVRVFDARGRVVPIARIAPPVQVRRDTLIPAPILGSGDAPVGARVSLRLDERGQARVAEVESGGRAARDTVTLGALLDARAVTAAAERLDLDVDIPVGQPVRVTIEASRDLDTWRTIAERTLYRAPGAAIADARFPLASAALDHDYLRVTWHAPSRLIAPVTIRRAVLVSRSGEGHVAVAARLPSLVDDHAVAFLAPAAPLASLRLEPAGDDGAIPILLLGRDGPEQPWTPLAGGVMLPGGSTLDLSSSPGVIRIEADQRGTGFSAPPRVQLGFAPRALAFAASGQPPFTLAAGREGAPDISLPLQALTTASDLAQATVEEGRINAPLTLAAPDDAQRMHLQGLLWVVLLAAVALLGGLVWWTWRRPAPPLSS